MLLINSLILWPKLVAARFLWAGPLLARLVVGVTFMMAGFGKLKHLSQVTEYFSSLGIPAPELLTPIVSGWEFIGGAMLILGLATRINAGALAVIMVVATASAQWSEVSSLVSLLGLEEITYFAVFGWLAIAGAGSASLDHWIERKADTR